jgi:predicted nuclease of predicted toxin-antitoxin system
MLRLLTDENFNNDIIRGLKLRLPHLDVVAVRQVGLAGSPDPMLLNWAAQNERTMLTHDVSTMISDAEELLRRSEPMAGVIVVPNGLRIGRAIKDLELLLEYSSQSDLRDRIEYLPLRPGKS